MLRIFILVILLQFSSAIVVSFLEDRVVINRQAVFGIVDQPVLILTLTLVAGFFLIRTWKDAVNHLGRWGLILIVAGGISNLLDRLIYGGVVDIVRFFNLFTFNLADTLITVGVGLILVSFYQTKTPQPLRKGEGSGAGKHGSERSGEA